MSEFICRDTGRGWCVYYGDTLAKFLCADYPYEALRWAQVWGPVWLSARA